MFFLEIGLKEPGLYIPWGMYAAQNNVHTK
jgi:hypothetical protein